jgi:cell division protein FtsB
MRQVKSKDKPARPGSKIIVGVVCLLLAFTIIPRAKMVWELSAKRDRLEQQKVVLQKANRELVAKEAKATGKENMEKIAREQLGMLKNGEKALIQVAPKK